MTGRTENRAKKISSLRAVPDRFSLNFLWLLSLFQDKESDKLALKTNNTIR